MLPEHVQNRDDIMNFIYMFQDYLNDGYRNIPKSTISYSYLDKEAVSCGIPPQPVVLSEQRRPYNHTTSMYKDRLGAPITPTSFAINGGIGSWSVPTTTSEYVEEYDKERDLSTWAIDPITFSQYTASNSTLLMAQTISNNDPANEYSYYLENKQWFSLTEYYNAVVKNINTYGNNNIFPINLFLSNVTNNISSSLAESTMTLTQLESFFTLEGDYSNITYYYYACNLAGFKSDFINFVGDSTVTFSTTTTQFPQFNRITDSNNYINSPPFSFTNLTYDQILSDNSLPGDYSNTFRIAFNIASATTKTIVLNELHKILGNNVFNFSVAINNINQFTPFITTNSVYPNVPCIGSAVLVIPKYQHPNVFYNYFAIQNQYRHDPKKASIVEKIYRMAYMKDPTVIDYEYIGLVSQHLGYSIGTDEDQINQNPYYITKEEKEDVVRQIINNLPEYYKIKGTDSGIEMVLLSFGLVAKVINLFTRASIEQDGYSAFIDERLVDGDIVNYNKISPITPTSPASIAEQQLSKSLSAISNSNALISGTDFEDWYPSPHFRIEINVLEDNLSLLRSSIQFKTIAKTIRQIKPINTVFQGFYGVLMAQYESLFLNPPTALSRAYQTYVMNGNSTTLDIADNWITSCEIEVEI